MNKLLTECVLLALLCNLPHSSPGFNWAGDSAYWLTDVSGFIHGIPCDRLGGPDDIKGMLFGNYERNSGASKAIWALWDNIKIEESEMVGWWSATQQLSFFARTKLLLSSQTQDWRST